jgi:hypothetical protein
VTVTTLYAQGIASILTKHVDPIADTLKVALVTSSYVPNYDTDQFWSDVNANEITGTGYTAGGFTVGSKTLTYDSSTALWTFTTTVDPTWPTATLTCRFGVLYVSTGTAGTSSLLTCADFGSDQIATAELFTLHVPTTGFFQLARMAG